MLVVFALVTLTRSAVAGVYDALTEPFAATPDALRAAADAVAALPTDPPEAPRRAKPGAETKPEKKDTRKNNEDKPATIEVLRSIHVRFDAAGLTTTTRHDIWRIERDDTSLRTGTMLWDPWREARPAVDLRVVSPDGKERRLDPVTLVEQSVATGVGEMYVDTRKLIAPLPGARKGAIVEQHETVAQIRPFLTDAQNGYIPVTIQRIGRAEVVLDAPLTLPLRFDSKNMGSAKESRSGGRRLVRWVIDDPALLAWPPELAPRENYTVRYVAWSTAADWSGIASQYSKLVDEKAILPPEAEAAAKAIRASEKDDRRAATAMALWINERARYVAVELGASAVVPRLPRDVLARGYGDCKDKATFLVAMLRSAGIAANVALLRAGWDADVNPALPGPNLFNHAITVLTGAAAPIWIDPTQPELPAGVLPAADTDHWALIASAGTRSLVRTPPARPLTARLDKEIVAADYGGASYRQSITFLPETAVGIREDARRTSLAELVDKAVEDATEGGRARTAAMTYDLDLVDLDRPTTETLSLTGVRELFVKPGDFSLKTGPGVSLGALPTRWQLGLVSDEHIRVLPIEMRAIQQSARVVVRPPRGYILASLPAPVNVTWPGGAFVWSWERLEGGAVGWSSSIEVPRSVALADVEGFVAAAEQAREAAEVTLRFLNEAQRLDEAGETSRALREWSRLAGLPDALLADRVGYAQALNAAGYAARAQAVVATLPVNDDTEDLFVTLAWDAAMQAPYGFGMARRFAPASFRTRARSLLARLEATDDDQRAEFYRGLLGRMQLFDDMGIYGRGDVEAAVATVGDELELLRGPVSLLLSLGDGEAAKEQTRWAKDDRRRGERVAAFLLAGDLDAAQKEANVLAPDGAQLRKVYSEAVSALGYARQWDAARQVASLIPDSEEAKDLVPELRRWTEYDPDEDTPLGATRRYIRAIGDPAHEGEIAATLTASSSRDSTMPWTAGGKSATDYLLDRAMTPRTLEIDGDAAGGFRLRWEPLWTRTPFRYYVVREKKQLKVRAHGGEEAELAEEAGARLDAGQLAGAQRWLDWALLDDQRPASSVYAGLWTRDGDRSADRARLIIAILRAGERGGDAEASSRAKTLRTAWLAGTADAAVGPALFSSLYVSGDVAGALALTDDLRARGGDALTVNPLRVQALARLGRADEAHKEARASLAGAVDTADHWTLLVSALSGGGAFDAAVRLGRDGVARFPKDASLLNQTTWPMLFVPALPDDAVSFADRILEGQWSSGRAHSSACVYAAAGRTDQARALVQRYVDEHDGDMDSSWSFVWGRIAEADAELVVARQAYAAVTDDTEDAASVGELARRRLAVIGLK
ncbi:MAG: DUF3857 domain-containing protein [Myxococcales bacterium]|nr:DUF3857 domain-containing protein [Myxococcales bacterium]